MGAGQIPPDGGRDGLPPSDAMTREDEHVRTAHEAQVRSETSAGIQAQRDCFDVRTHPIGGGITRRVKGEET